MKPCVACAEEIQTEAMLCRFCGIRQDDASYSRSAAEEPQVIDKRRLDPVSGEVRPGASSYMSPTPASAPKSGGCLKPALWVFGPIILLAIIFALLSDNGTSGAGEARVACHNTVKSALKAPTTAKFNSTVSKHNTRANDFLVEGTVDAQNSFGAMVRSRFQCVVDTSGSSPRVTLNYLG